MQATATITINNQTILWHYTVNKIKSVLEMILLDLQNNFVEFWELSNKEYENLSEKSKWKLNNIDKLNLIEL